MYKVMGLDIGTKRIGIALSDFLLLTAQPCETINREPEKAALESIMQIAKDNSVKKIVVGLPKNMNGTIGSQAEDCMTFTNLLKKNLEEIEFIFEDERLTSRQAENILALQGKKYTKNKGLVDLKSACIILQQYLDRTN